MKSTDHKTFQWAFWRWKLWQLKCRCNPWGSWWGGWKGRERERERRIRKKKRGDYSRAFCIVVSAREKGPKCERGQSTGGKVKMGEWKKVKMRMEGKWRVKGVKEGEKNLQTGLSLFFLSSIGLCSKKGVKYGQKGESEKRMDVFSRRWVYVRHSLSDWKVRRSKLNDEWVKCSLIPCVFHVYKSRLPLLKQQLIDCRRVGLLLHSRHLTHTRALMNK